MSRCPNFWITNQNLFSYLKPLLNYGHYAQSVWHHDLTKGEDISGRVGDEAPATIGKGGVGAKPLAANEFLRFSHKKHSFQHTLLSKKDIPMSCGECSHYCSVRQYKSVLVVHV